VMREGLVQQDTDVTLSCVWAGLVHSVSVKQWLMKTGLHSTRGRWGRPRSWVRTVELLSTVFYSLHALVLSNPSADFDGAGFQLQVFSVDMSLTVRSVGVLWSCSGQPRGFLMHEQVCYRYAPSRSGLTVHTDSPRR
jgi:hypothetical protein